jgi:photosystem II stability/assembly factor-like uncharacterized protein
MQKKLSLLIIVLIGAIHLFAQIKISSSTFGKMEARHLGPGTMSGRITAIDGVAEDGKTIYVGTAGGGVWKSTNAGASFKSVFDKYCQSIGAIAIDQKNPKVIYVGTGESNMRNTVSIGNGLYKSTDGGDNWVKIGLDSTEHISRIVIDPKNPNIIYVAVPGPLWSDGSHRGLYKSTDAGKTWNKILYINERSGCADVAVDPSNPDIVYASTWQFRRLPYTFNSGGNGSGMYKSTDGGKTWKELMNGLPQKPFGRIAFALAPSAPNNLLAIVESGETGLFISSDGGETWKQQSATANIVARPFYFSTIAVDPKDARRVYRPAFIFSYSDDGGYSFADATNEGGWLHSDMHALWINPNNTNQLYVGTDGGVYYSLDRGATWHFVQNLPVGQFYHVALDNAETYNLYGGLQDNGSWTAPSSAPGGVSNAAWRAIYGGDGFWVQPDPTDPDFAYAESQGGEAGRVNLKTGKIVNIKPQPVAGEEKLRWNWNTPLVVGAKNKKNLYMGSQFLYRSTDQGRNWQKISPDLTTNDKKKQDQDKSGGLSADNTSAENHCTIFTIAESPVDENIIWVGTDDGNLQYTADGGKTWTNVASHYAAAGIPAQTWVSSVEPSAFDTHTVYATFDNHMYGDHKTYIGRSADRGRTWKLFASKEFSGFAHKIKEDLKNKDLLFAGTERGLFASVDGGQNWFRMKNHIPDYVMVRDIQIHPASNDLVIATHGRGIMIVDDITPMRSLTKTIIDQDVFMFDIKPIVLTNGRFGDAGFPTTGGWMAPNAAAIPPIQYYLKERVSIGDVNLEIYDPAGKLVKEIPGTIRKGINKVTWDLRMQPPKVAGGGTKIDFGAFVAPMVLPGEYTVKLNVGDKVYSKPLKLVHDPKNKDFTMEDRQLQFKTAMDLYKLHEQLAATVDQINEKQRMLQENIAKLKDTASKKMLQDYNEKLEDLRSTLLATKQKSLFADEKKLREEISDVYTAVCGQEARPSNLQVQRVSQLQQNVRKAEEKRLELVRQFDGMVETVLSKEGLPAKDASKPAKTF